MNYTTLYELISYEYDAIKMCMECEDGIWNVECGAIIELLSLRQNWFISPADIDLLSTELFREIKLEKSERNLQF